RWRTARHRPRAWWWSPPAATRWRPRPRRCCAGRCCCWTRSSGASGTSTGREGGSRQQVADGYLPDRLTGNDYCDAVARREGGARGVVVALRAGVDLQAVIDQVDDPVHRHPGGGVQLLLGALVGLEARVRHLDEHRHLGGGRVAPEVIPWVPAHDSAVRLRLAVGKRNRLLAADVPAGG